MIRFTTEDYNGHGVEVIGIGESCFLNCNFHMAEQKAFFDALERVFGDDMRHVYQEKDGSSIIQIHRTMDGDEFMEKVNEIFYDNVRGD